MNEQTEEMLTQFKCSILSSKYIFKAGAVAHFVGGTYNTSDPEEIVELTNEVTKKHPNITKVGVFAKSDLDPLKGLKKRFYAEFLAEQEAAQNGSRDFGKSDRTGLIASAGNTVSMAAITSGKVGAAKVMVAPTKVTAPPVVVRSGVAAIVGPADADAGIIKPSITTLPIIASTES